MMNRFTKFSDSNSYPQAKLHTQWPGEGVVGDETFDQAFSSQVEDMADRPRMEAMNREALNVLLDRIGPSILMGHSQSTPIIWGVADDRPEKVIALLAVEPNGPAFYSVKFTGAPNWFKDGKMGRPYGITLQPLTFEPPITSPEDLAPAKDDKADGENLAKCWLPSPARKLPNLAGKPILIVTSEASYHTPYDHCTSKFLTKSGVENDFIRLSDVGIKGNGHMMMLESNSLEIAELIGGWLDNKLN